MGEAGADHVAEILKKQLAQVLDQVCCKTVNDLPDHLIKSK
jgi:L-lactate dehydrogenase (cytochrome)